MLASTPPANAPPKHSHRRTRGKLQAFKSADAIALKKASSSFKAQSKVFDDDSPSSTRDSFLSKKTMATEVAESLESTPQKSDVGTEASSLTLESRVKAIPFSVQSTADQAQPYNPLPFFVGRPDRQNSEDCPKEFGTSMDKQFSRMREIMHKSGNSSPLPLP